MPPNGSAGMPANAITELTETMPHRSLRGDLLAALLGEHRGPEAVAAALARSTASSMSRTRLTTSSGPNVSSVTAALSSGTSTSTIGST